MWTLLSTSNYIHVCFIIKKNYFFPFSSKSDSAIRPLSPVCYPLALCPWSVCISGCKTQERWLHFILTMTEQCYTSPLLERIWGLWKVAKVIVWRNVWITYVWLKVSLIGYIFIWHFILLFVFNFFWQYCVTCRILVPGSEIKSGPPEWKCGVSTTGPPGKSLWHFRL